MQTVATPEAVRRRPLLADISIALIVGLLAALAKRHLDFHLGVPGHAGVGWIAALVAGRLVNERPGMATLAGASMAVWGVPVGLGHSLGYNLMLYGLAGSLLDSGLLLRLPLRRPWGATAAGTVVHLAKYRFVFANAWVSDILKRVEVFGFLAALANHVIFGAAGGLLGWLVWRLGWVRLMAQIARRKA